MQVLKAEEAEVGAHVLPRQLQDQVVWLMASPELMVEFTLRMLGLEGCADTVVGDAMIRCVGWLWGVWWVGLRVEMDSRGCDRCPPPRRCCRSGISGGQKRRLTCGELLVGGRELLLLDEISTGAAPASQPSRAAACPTPALSRQQSLVCPPPVPTLPVLACLACPACPRSRCLRSPAPPAPPTPLSSVQAWTLPPHSQWSSI